MRREDGRELLVPMVRDAVRDVDVAARSHRCEPRFPRRGIAVEIDIFTLFPEWFQWFHTQRHVRNAQAAGSRVECVDIREHTPLTGGQVDDTPFGGGAGMVLRVDVMDAALRARYGVDPVALREQRRVIALTPDGRLLDDGYVDRACGRGGADAAVRPLRGLRRADRRAFRRRDAVDRALRALRRRAGRDGGVRRGAAQAAGRTGRRPLGRRGVLQRGAGGQPRVPPLHAPRRVPGVAGPRGAALRPPRAHRKLAARAQPRTGERAAAYAGEAQSTEPCP